MKYDDASWHYGGDLPADLPAEAGATHIAMFVAWAALNGLASSCHTEDAVDELTALKRRDLTPTEWFMLVCDGKFTTEDLSDQGNAFALAYYGSGEGLHSKAGSYLDDYCGTFPTEKSIYEVRDSRASFDARSPWISSRLQAWGGR